MSTRDQRRDWQEFRTLHGATVTEFKKRWFAMFSREPKPNEINDYTTKRAELKAPLGRAVAAPAAHITVRRTISMGHRLPSYQGICSSMHGHNIVFEVTLRTKSFTDFKAVDLHLAKLLDPLDHAMVLHDKDPFVPVLLGLPQRMVLLNVEPTTEALAQLIFNEMSQAYRVVNVTVHETAKYSASCADLSDVKRVEL